MKAFFLSASALSLLAACSSGGGGSSSDGIPDRPAFNSFAEAQQEAGTVRANSVVTSASYEADDDFNIVATGDPETERDALADLTFNDEGEVTRFQLRQSNADIVLDVANGDRIFSDNGVILAESADGEVVLVAADPNVVGFNYQSFGTWQTGVMTGSGRAAVGSFGARTPDDQMPDSGTASYQGASVGQVVDADGEAQVTTSQIFVGTDFESVQLQSGGTAIVDPVSGTVIGTRSDLDFTANGQLDGSQFQAAINTPDLEGGVNGQFYGPSGEEVGGTFEAESSTGGYIGAFGASQSSPSAPGS